MSTHRWIDRICLVTMIISLFCTILFMNGESLGVALVVDEDAEGYSGSTLFTRNDLNGDWDPSGATVITLNGQSAEIAGNGAYWLNGSLVIAQSGQYVLSGTLTDGSIIVSAKKNSKVWILLSGVSVTCSDGACLRVEQADKVFLTLAAGTENTMRGGAAFSAEALNEDACSVILARDDLTINGSGSLTLESAGLNGIDARDDLVLAGGTLTVTAPRHGIRVNDALHITSVVLRISAGQDGIHCEGDLLVQDGTLQIAAKDDGLHSDAVITVLGGSLDLSACGEPLDGQTVDMQGGELF